MKTLKIALIGAGGRGKDYTNLMQDERFQLVGVADPIEESREYIKNLHKIPEDKCFKTWEDLLSQDKFADVVMICTSDDLHYGPAMKAIEKGYNILIEKPVAPTAEECAEIANYAKEKGVKALVCHVLRYTPLFLKIKQMINENMIGKVVSIHHCEAVGHTHQSHSFVRGQWGNSDTSSCMILAKSCHDMDIIQWLMGDKCKKVHSFGSLSYFTKENAPEGSPEFCIEGCPHADTCYYNALKLYDGSIWFRRHALKTDNPTQEQIDEMFTSTNYGRCVYKCDNNVVDRQVVNLEFENGGVASFNMCAFNEGGRYIRVMGTNGELYGDLGGNFIDYFSFKTRKHTIINPTEGDMDVTVAGGHAGGDEGLVNTLYKYMAEDYSGDMLSEIGISVDNHLIAFAAEKSRLEDKVIFMDEFKKEYIK